MDKTTTEYIRFRIVHVFFYTPFELNRLKSHTFQNFSLMRPVIVLTRSEFSTFYACETNFLFYPIGTRLFLFILRHSKLSICQNV